MTSPPWQQFVANLAESGFESPYLDRLEAKLPTKAAALTRRDGGEAAQRQIEQEIVQEVANALGRAGEKVDLALLKLDVIARELDTAEPSDRPAKVAAFNAQREVAKQALWELTVHREAVGIRRNEVLAQFYPIPPART